MSCIISLSLKATIERNIVCAQYVNNQKEKTNYNNLPSERLFQKCSPTLDVLYPN